MSSAGDKTIASNNTLKQTPYCESKLPGNFSLLFAGLFLLLLAPAISSSQVRSPLPWLPTNFDTTVAGNFRGAKIVSKTQLDSMRSRYGIKTVINLAKDALPKSGPSEIEWTKELGIEYFHVYLGTKPPSVAQWNMIKEKLKGGQVYLHCAHGADRTGAIVARYRVEVQQVPFETAWKEARRFGFKPWLADFKAWIEAGKSSRE